ncbi:hypothetical protein IE53DRAFT_13764 [Violaceomyces palustris]|uniref:Uncharacterized protein n=1 Tax=Violaceomyces palustris TaxID=1673888 RepID=A0ACD0P2P0_9BASI|nr:hypothetical protein IE53DRAFT_13764 [Violaceomyces palustris]
MNPTVAHSMLVGPLLFLSSPRFLLLLPFLLSPLLVSSQCIRCRYPVPSIVTKSSSNRDQHQGMPHHHHHRHDSDHEQDDTDYIVSANLVCASINPACKGLVGQYDNGSLQGYVECGCRSYCSRSGTLSLCDTSATCAVDGSPCKLSEEGGKDCLAGGTYLGTSVCTPVVAPEERSKLGPVGDLD